MSVDPKLRALVDLAQRPAPEGVALALILMVKGVLIVGVIAPDAEFDRDIDDYLAKRLRETAPSHPDVDPAHVDAMVDSVRGRVAAAFARTSEEVPEDQALTLRDAVIMLGEERMQVAALRVKLSEVDAWHLRPAETYEGSN